MPKKTKKEKIIAEFRRRLEKVKDGNGKTDLEEKEMETWKEKSSLSVSRIQDLQSQVPISAFGLPSSFVVQDLRKTFLLAGFAISLELVVYWLTELGGSKFSRFLPMFR